MEIINATEKDKIIWNQFVSDNYPPVGAFMQSWEWGDFKVALGKKISRWLVREGDKLIAVLTLVEHNLPLGFSYGYIPRGPVVLKEYDRSEFWLDLLKTLRSWLVKNFTHLLFVRLEPPIKAFDFDLAHHGFAQPNYYVQPRYNHIVNLSGSDEETLQHFHPSTRSNINRGQKRGVTVDRRDHTEGNHYDNFLAIARDTIKRNDGLSIYPGREYFSSLFATMPAYHGEDQPTRLSLATFYGLQNGALAAMHFVLFFGRTATYLYGASSTAHLSSKVTTCLHYAAMQEAKRGGLAYYDLGGVDEKLWPTLTKFKRQFQGEESSYLGNIDIPLSPRFYRLYNWLQNFKRQK